MYITLLTFLSLLFSFSTQYTYGADSTQQTGTLIVTYNTGPEAERLDRVRFLLISESEKQCMYPKGNTYVEDEDCCSRMVVIENLPIGNYRIKFLVPNADKAFEEVPEKKITLNKDDVIRIDQTITLRMSPQQLRNNREMAFLTNLAALSAGRIDDTQLDLKYGTLNFEASFPTGETVQITLKGENSRPLSVVLKSHSGKLHWKSPPLLPGTYELSYFLPEEYSPAPVDTVIIREGKNTAVRPRLMTSSSLHVVANVPEAIFLLRTPKSSQAWKGEGREFTFKGLQAGNYILSSSTSDPDYYIPPKEIKIYLSEVESKLLKVNFQLAGRLIVKTNVNHSNVSIQEIGGSQKHYQDVIVNHSRSFTLPEGRYRVSITQVEPSISAALKFYPPDPVEISVKPLRSEELNLTFRLENAPPVEKQRRLIINTNLSNASFSVNKYIDNKKSVLGRYTGKFTQLTLPSADHYEIVYDDIPNFQTPSSTTLLISPHTEKNVLATYIPLQESVPVPEGKAIIGSAGTEDKINELNAKIVMVSSFAIGTYEVTNIQYATWLNQAQKAGTIAYVEEADNKGQVLDLQGNLLFKTFTADPYSQISAQQQSEDSPTFTPLPGKDSYPVINVSWYGAMAYCKDNHCRLPTEAEWEKAAGMAPPAPGVPLRKFVYGFSKDTIDSTWANYKDNDRIIQFFQVLTTPVGFYNGINSLALTPSHPGPQPTHKATSPYGAFDMSGNVWEWVSDWYDESYYANMSDKDPQGPETGTLKVVKGGCYDSLADGVRVSERMGLAPGHADAYTGFRVAFDTK